jgi:predicted porin
MKITTIAASALLLSSPSLGQTEGLSPSGLIAQVGQMEDNSKNYQFYGWAEYGVETDTADAGIGMNYFITDRLIAYGEVDFLKLDNEEADFDTFNFGIDYALTYNLSAYAELEFDKDFDYQDVIVGVSFIY